MTQWWQAVMAGAFIVLILPLLLFLYAKCVSMGWWSGRRAALDRNNRRGESDGDEGREA